MSFKKLLYTLLGLCLLMVSAMAQQNAPASLTGRITDLNGEPLYQASITIVGTYLGTAANMDGEYVINNIKPNDYQVKVQFIGFETKIYNGISFEPGENKTLDIQLKEQSESLNEVTIVGRSSQVNLEAAASEVSIKQEDIAQMNVRDVKEVLEMQAGVVKTQDGLQIRGARVYETSYIVDGISAQDPLAGTGFGVDVSSASIANIDLITGGAGAEYGGGSSGVVNTTIREGSQKFEIAGSWQRDYITNSDVATSFNTDRVEASLGSAVPFTDNKLTFFTNVSAFLTDEYFGSTADQLKSSLLPNTSEFWAPRQTNSYTHTLKLAYKIRSGTKITLTNQHSLNVNQNTRSLQIVGFDAILTPGFQYQRSLNLDNATTYTHHSNLTALNVNHLINKNWGLSLSLGRLFTNLRADANGRPFRSATVDQIMDEENIITDPVAVFNPNSQDGTYYVLPGNGLYNNGGISPTWHDHYAQEYTVNAKATYIPGKTHEISFGLQQTFKEYQWVDVNRPWVGAPIRINDSVTTPAVSIGSSNDIWKVNPIEGGLFFQDKITYKGIIATLGARFAFWAPGKFADDAVANPEAPVIDQVREDYERKTASIFGLRWKARLLPKINVSFPVTENNVLYFNYGHSMRLPHPRFLYAGLDPVYQDRSFLSNLGNPDLDPEVNVSYEVGLKSKLTRDLAMTFTAFNNNRFDYIVSRSALVQDQTGRTVTKTFYINQDYAKIYGVEFGLNYRVGKYFRTFSNIAYQVARGKSNSARESALQIEQNGEVPLTREQFLAFDRPWNINLGVVFSPDSTLPIMGMNLTGFSAYLSYQFTSGYRYTPQVKVGSNDLNRPEYEEQTDRYLEETADNWHNFDLKLTYTIPLGLKNGKGISLSVEIRNLLNNKNSQIINPVTGRAYQYGDDVPLTWRDPRPEYNGPQETGTDPRNPARYLAPRQVLYGLAFRF
ncbi:MAG: TonB-dependent receptor [Owenweeksia sp.]|nr:TonB-dependent receptor [Owenweeksia sp.]MBF99422.1 TonB-dependent receptor [Owenweeksia sp.]HCQ17318.1 TonB-dependent receptor [Cryomorphaceae bacterium]|tara:strand:- start:1619 stop:4465 length:2847 start_codon:yes stop_codon:yes gene_type:complete